MTKFFFQFFCLLIISRSSYALEYYVDNIDGAGTLYTKAEVDWLKKTQEVVIVDQIQEVAENNGELKLPVSNETTLFFNEIELKTGLRFRYKSGYSWEEVRFFLNEDDPILIPAVFYHQNLSTEGLYSSAYDSIKFALYAHSENQQITSIAGLDGKKVAIVAAEINSLEIKKVIPKAVIVEEKTLSALINSVVTGKADALISNRSNILLGIQNGAIIDIKEIKQQVLPTKDLHFLSNKNTKILNSILTKTISRIHQEKKLKIDGFWTSVYYHSSSPFLINIMSVLFLCLVTVYFAHKKDQAKLMAEIDKTKKINNEINRLKTELEQQNQHQTNALDGGDEGVWDWDVLTQKYYLNPSWLNLLGYNKKKIQSGFESFAELINPEHTDRILTEYEKLFQGKVDKIRHEYQIKKENAEWLWIETRGRVVERDKNNKPCRFAGIHIDISERKAIEERLSTTQKTHIDQVLRLDVQNKEMKKTQTRLLESENKAKSIVEMAKEAIIVVNSHSKVVSWNKGAEKLFGYSADEMDWAPLETVIPDDHSQSYLAGMDTRTEAFELEGLHKNGQKIPIELSTNSWDANDGIYSSSIIRDLTERKRMEQALSEQFKKVEDSKHFLNTLFDAQKQLLIVFAGQKIQDVNRFFLDFFKISELKEFTQQHNCISELFMPHDSSDFIELEGNVNWIQQVIDKPSQAHKVLISQDKQDYIFDVDVVAFEFNDEILFLTVFSDITELEKAKNLTQESLEFTEQLIEGLSSPFYFQDKDFKFQKVNSALCKLFGKSKKQIISHTVLDLLEKSEAGQFHSSDQNLLHTATQIDEITINHLELGIINIIVYKAAMYDKDHNFDGIIGLIIDITQRKTIEKQLAESKALITGSIEYSSLIQQAIIPDTSLFDQYFKDYFIIWKPRDVVGGDIFFLDGLRHKDECLIMVIDCTGHGVPGAFVTMLVKATERQIINDILINNKTVNTADILKEFNAQIKSLLRQNDENAVSNAGFDGGVLYINFKEKVAKYSGAETPLFVVQNEKLSMIKGDRHSIGYKRSDIDYQFSEHIISIEQPTKFYLSTDGYFDQNGGSKGFPMGKKSFMKQIEEVSSDGFSTQKTELLEKLDSYRQGADINDDITLIGLSVDTKYIS